MNIMITLPGLMLGGAETHLINLADALRDRGVDVSVALIRPEREVLDRLAGISKVVGLLPTVVVSCLRRLEAIPPTRYLVSRHFVRLALYRLHSVPRLRALLRERQIDVVVSALWEADVVTGLAIAGLSSDRRPKWVVSAAYDFEAPVRRSLIKSVLLTPLRHLYRQANAFVAPSSRIAGQLRSLLVRRGVPQVWLIPNAVPVDELSAIASARIETTRGSSPSSSDEGPVLVAVGRLVPEKGFDVLLRALQEVRKSFPATRLMVIGEGPSRPILERLASELNLDQAVVWMGFLKNPFPHMSRAQILVAPSRWESFGNAVAEAMALGVPVIATRCGGPEDLIESGLTGILVPVDDVQALARAIVALLGDEETRTELATAARASAAQFAAGAVGERYLERFRTLFG